MLDPIALVIRNMLNVRRLGNGVTEAVRALLDDLFDEIAGDIAALDPAAPTADVWRQGRVQKLLDKIEERAGEKFDEIYKTVRQMVAEIGDSQSAHAVEMLKSATRGIDVGVGEGEVGINLAKSIIDNDPLEGDLMSQAFDGVEHNVITSVRREIQQGMAESETTADIIQRVRGSAISGSPGEYFGGVMDTTTKQAEAIVRTAVNDISNKAILSTYQANDDIVSKVRFVATLDGRTTFECMGLDGEEWELDDPDMQVPPLHWNCRSTLVPVIDWKGLGVKAPAEGQRASQDGPVPADTNYQQWLKEQDAETQDAVLGPARAELFRADKITLKDLVNSDGETINVDDL